MTVIRNGEVVSLVDKQGCPQPWLVQPGDIICDVFGKPLRDKKGRKHARI